jgi:hypothetical protein
VQIGKLGSDQKKRPAGVASGFWGVQVAPLFLTSRIPEYDLSTCPSSILVLSRSSQLLGVQDLTRGLLIQLQDLKLPAGAATEAVSTNSTVVGTSGARSSRLRHQKRVVVRDLTLTVTALGSRRESNATSAGAHQKCPPATKSLATKFHRGWC